MIALIGVVAAVAIPMLRSEAPVALGAAAAEAANVLRTAVAEARRTGRWVLVDGTAPGRLRLYASDVSGAILGDVNDPLTKAPMELDIAARPWRGQVALEAAFINGGIGYRQLLVGPAGQLQAFDAGVNRGALQAGSGVVLTAGTLNAMVAIDATSGRVTSP